MFRQFKVLVLLVGDNVDVRSVDILLIKHSFNTAHTTGGPGNLAHSIYKVTYENKTRQLRQYMIFIACILNKSPISLEDDLPT